jgi:hypothetical protein
MDTGTRRFVIWVLAISLGVGAGHFCCEAPLTGVLMVAAAMFAFDLVRARTK